MPYVICEKSSGRYLSNPAVHPSEWSYNLCEAHVYTTLRGAGEDVDHRDEFVVEIQYARVRSVPSEEVLSHTR